MLKISGISKRYGHLEALRGIDFEVQRGEFFALLGPSGCGKTTLLRILGGFEQADAGELLLDGVAFTHIPAYRRASNMVFQRYALFPHLDVRGNIAFGLRMKGLPRAEISTRVEEALALVEMGAHADRSVLTLSGGQQQRVAIARAIVNRPKFLLLDEPLAALDLKLRQRMQIELRRLQRSLGLTFIYVTHAQDEALSLADRIAVINAGRVEQIGSPEGVYRHPQSEFVGNFIGSVNILRGTLGPQRADRQRGVMLPGGETVWGSFASVGLDDTPSGSQVSLLVRPEDLVLTAKGEGGGLEVVVKDVIFRGASLDVLLTACGGNTHLVWQAGASLEHLGWLVQPGEKLHITWSPERGLILPQGTSGHV